ncbi:MAG: hypothetical protein WAL67_09570 [Candidatus Cybelea sp.]
MPHIILEYSSNLSNDALVNQLLGKLHDTLGGIESFETDRIKSRALRFDAYKIGTDDHRGFVHARARNGFVLSWSTRDAATRTGKKAVGNYHRRGG